MDSEEYKKLWDMFELLRMRIDELWDEIQKIKARLPECPEPVDYQHEPWMWGTSSQSE